MKKKKLVMFDMETQRPTASEIYLMVKVLEGDRSYKQLWREHEKLVKAVRKLISSETGNMGTVYEFHHFPTYSPDPQIEAVKKLVGLPASKAKKPRKR